MTKTVLVRNVAKAFVITQYLRDLCKAIGSDAYLKSFVRRQHGPGNGFFGVSNTGSNDCLKETLRGITDGLDLRFDTFQRIPYVSKTCLNLPSRSKILHRIEHTVEVSALYLDLESRWIVGEHTLTATSIARWFIENQIVCLIEKHEQTGKYSHERPFGKYSSPIYYRGRDVSLLSHSEIKDLNRETFSEELSFVDEYDFGPAISDTDAKLVQLKGKHKLPPLQLAIELANDEMGLLHRHYVDKVLKVTTPGNRYYNKDHAERWKKWNASRETQ